LELETKLEGRRKLSNSRLKCPEYIENDLPELKVEA
jgi:hypothetical protein